MSSSPSLESELRSFFSLRNTSSNKTKQKKNGEILSSFNNITVKEIEEETPETTTSASTSKPSSLSVRKQNLLRTFSSPKQIQDNIKATLSRETLYISPSDRIGSNYSEHTKYLTLRGFNRRTIRPASPKRPKLDGRKSMENYLKVVEELSVRDLNTYFVDKILKRLNAQNLDSREEISKEIRDGLAKAKILYDLRGEDQRHHHGIDSKLRKILLKIIDRVDYVMNTKRTCSRDSTSLDLDRAQPIVRKIGYLWSENEVPTLIDLPSICKTFASPMRIEDIIHALKKQQEMAIMKIRDVHFRPCEMVLRDEMIRSVREIMKDFISKRKRVRACGRQQVSKAAEEKEFHDFFLSLQTPHTTYLAPLPDADLVTSKNSTTNVVVEHFKPQLLDIWNSTANLHKGTLRSVVAVSARFLRESLLRSLESFVQCFEVRTFNQECKQVEAFKYHESRLREIYFKKQDEITSIAKIDDLLNCLSSSEHAKWVREKILASSSDWAALQKSRAKMRRKTRRASKSWRPST